MLGASAARIDAVAAKADPEADAFPVMPENWAAVQAFCDLSTQWRCQVVAGLGGGAVVWLGLDYPGLQAALDLAGVPRRERRDLFARLQIMERAALPVLNARRGR